MALNPTISLSTSPDLHSIENELGTKNNVDYETMAKTQEKGLSLINKIALAMTKYVQQSPREFVPALERMYENMGKLRTIAGATSAFFKFGIGMYLTHGLCKHFILMEFLLNVIHIIIKECLKLILYIILGSYIIINYMLSNMLLLYVILIQLKQNLIYRWLNSNKS